MVFDPEKPYEYQAELKMQDGIIAAYAYLIEKSEACELDMKYEEEQDMEAQFKLQ